VDVATQLERVPPADAERRRSSARSSERSGCSSTGRPRSKTVYTVEDVRHSPKAPNAGFGTAMGWMSSRSGSHRTKHSGASSVRLHIDTSRRMPEG
jgi:hypothetical protein